MARHNIAYQFNSSIEQAFKPGGSRHSSKHAGEAQAQVFSWGEKKSLQKIGFQMRDYLKKNYPQIKYVRDIKADHWQSFLVEKSKTCSSATLKNYVSRIHKLEVLTNNKFNIQTDWRGNLLVPQSRVTPNNEKLRVQVMDQKDLNKILEAGENSKSKAVPAVKLAYKYGLRVSEMSNWKVNQVNIDKKEFTVIGKGGRPRTLSINPKDIQLFKELTAGKSPNSKVIGIKADSINAYLNRTMEKLGIKEKYPETGIHSIRKLTAQKKYDKYRKQGYNKRESMDKVSKFLGHGKGRYDVFNTYVSNQW